MKTLENLYNELQQKVHAADPQSGTYRLFSQGKHAIGKKLVEEACESWMASEHEGKARAAEELSQLLYYVLVMMLACDLTFEDVYRTL